jgi:siroheme synthase
LDAWDTRAASAGRLRLVIDDGAEDRLSLRAARALAQADVLIADAGATPATLALARREARRLAPSQVDLAQLKGMSGQGLQIVWVGAETNATDILEALAAEGVAIERLRPAPA